MTRFPGVRASLDSEVWLEVAALNYSCLGYVLPQKIDIQYLTGSQEFVFINAKCWICRRFHRVLTPASIVGFCRCIGLYTRVIFTQINEIVMAQRSPN